MDYTVVVHPGLHDAAIAMLRVAVGGFFTISGFHKLVHKERHAALVRTLQDLHIPYIRFNQWWVPSVEFAGGIALMIGFGTPMAAFLLGTICLVATCTDGWARVRAMQPINRADLVDDLLYLPEVLYLLKIGAILLTGPGLYSVDALLFPLT